jgi:predicted permease
MLAMYPEPLPSRAQVVLDARVLAVGVATIALAALLAGLPAARQTRSLDLGDGLRDWSRSSGGRRARRRAGALIVGQVALSVTLLFAAGVLLRSFWNLTHVSLGFESRGILTFWLMPAASRDGRPAEQLHRELVESLRALPGVRGVATSYDIPTAGRSFGSTVRREGDAPDRAPSAGVQMVSPGYFGTLGIPLRGGRDIEERDRRGAPPVVVVNESFAAWMFPTEPALGRRIVVWDTTHTIVGVVGDARRGRPLWDAPEPEMYFAADQRGQGWRYVLVRADDERAAAALVPSVRAEVRRLDPSVPLAELATIEERLREASMPQRFRSTLVGALGALALLLSIVGIHGVVAYTVGQRTREIGIRLALGETQRAVRLRVVRQALAPAALGVLAGATLAGVAARWLERFLLGVPPRDLATLGAVSALFLVVTVAAAYAPALRASRIDPTMALRAE